MVVQGVVVVDAVLDVVGVVVPDGVVDGGPDGDGVFDGGLDGDGVDDGGPDDVSVVGDGVDDGGPDDDGVADDGVADGGPDGDGVADVGLDCVDGGCSDDVGGGTSAALVINIPVETKLETRSIWSATNKTCILYSALNYGV